MRRRDLILLPAALALAGEAPRLPRALGLAIPTTLLVTADEVIE